MADQKDNARERELARLDRIEQDRRMVRAYGLTDDRLVESVIQWTDTLTEPATPEQLKKKVQEVRDANATAPDTGVKTEAPKVQAGEDRRDKIVKGWDGFFDYRSAEGFQTFRQGLRYSLQGTEWARDGGTIGTEEIKKVLGAGGAYTHRMNELERRDANASAYFSDDERDTCALQASRADLRKPSLYSLLSHGDTRFAEAVLQVDVPQIVADRQHKAAQKAYQRETTDTCTIPAGGINLLISEEETVVDFKTYRSIRWQSLDLPAAVAEGAPYLDTANPNDEEETGSISKFGLKIGVSIEAIAGDDVGFMRRLPDMIGATLGRRVARTFFDRLRLNTALTSDGVALAAAAHNNWNNTAISYANLQLLCRSIRGQVAYSAGATGDREFICGVPKNVICANTIYDTVLSLITLDTDPTTGNRAASSLVNPETMPLKAYAVPNWDGYTELNDYWVTVDPKGPGAPIMKALWYNSKMGEVFVQDAEEVGTMWSNDIKYYKGRIIYGVIGMDYRGVAACIVP